MTDLVVWGGPVYAPGGAPKGVGIADIADVAWANPTEILTLSGNGSSYFSSLAASWKDPVTGRILPALLRENGKRAEDYEHIAIAGFSAFHGLASQLLATDGDMIDAAVLIDSCFSAFPGYAGKEGYVEFGKLAAAGDRLMVMSSSAGRNNPPLPPSTSGSECAYQSFVDAAGSKYSWFDVPPPLPEISAYSTGDGRSLRSRGLYLLDYGSQFTHQQHIHQLSNELLQTFLVPYLAGDTSLTGQSEFKVSYLVAAAAVAAGLYFVFRQTR